MPSFNLSNVDDANFNGSTVETINLNGSEIWQKVLGQNFTLSNRTTSMSGDKLSPDFTAWGFFATHPTLSIIEYSQPNTNGSISPGYVNGYRIGGIWDYTGALANCVGGGLHFFLEGNNVPAPGTHLIVEGQSFSFASAGNYDRWGSGWGRSNTYAGSTYMTGWHWHGQGKGLLRGGTSAVTII